MFCAAGDLALRAAGRDGAVGCFKRYNLVHGVFRPNAFKVYYAACKARCCVCKHVPAMEAVRLVASLQAVHAFVYFAHGNHPVKYGGKAAVIRRHHKAAVVQFGYAAAPRRANAGVNNAYEHRAALPVRYRIPEQERALPHVKRAYFVVQIEYVKRLIHHSYNAVHAGNKARGKAKVRLKHYIG